MKRRRFLRHTATLMGTIVGAAMVPGTAAAAVPAQSNDNHQFDEEEQTWQKIRQQFVHLENGKSEYVPFFLASHPQSVSDAIDKHRLGFDQDPHAYFHDEYTKAVRDVGKHAGQYLGVDPKDIAFTDSTTMGLALLYNGLKMKPDQEILTSTSEHYSSKESLRLRNERMGTKIVTIDLYKHIATVSAQEIVDNIVSNITAKTRVLALTWLHSHIGLKLPVQKIAKALEKINANRSEEDRVLFCLDGVHALGIENVTLPELGVDFFVSGCHKWMFGPRGTGILWGKKEAWPYVIPTIPSFNRWFVTDKTEEEFGLLNSPGGFKSYEYYWAVNEAFKFHLDIGKDKIEKRVHALNTLFKQGLAELPDVTVHTPMSTELSAGISAFSIKGYDYKQVIDYLSKKNIYVSASGSSVGDDIIRLVRLAPGLLSSKQEVLNVVDAVSQLVNKGIHS